ncbi:hypothetical protein CSC81_15935, partial [Tenacibaculum discolor]
KKKKKQIKKKKTKIKNNKIKIEHKEEKYMIKDDNAKITVKNKHRVKIKDRKSRKIDNKEIKQNIKLKKKKKHR